MATRRANHAATAPPATAKRGRLSERAWSDVLRAARIARAEGVALRVHGIAIYNKRKPLKLKNKVCVAPGAEKADGDMHSRSVIYRAACLVAPRLFLYAHCRCVSVSFNFFSVGRNSSWM